MREQLIKASKLHFEAHIEKHRMNLEYLFHNPVGVAEHSDIMETIEKELSQISHYCDLLEALELFK